MRRQSVPLLIAVLAAALFAAGVGAGATPPASPRGCERGGSGGTVAERTLATRILCALNPVYIARVRLVAPPKLGRVPPPLQPQ
jgi:hypothetical protein